MHPTETGRVAKPAGLVDATGKEIVRRTLDGWDEDANIHEPGRLIVIERAGRMYTVGPRGEWRRRKDLEALARAQKERRIVVPDLVRPATLGR